MRRQPKEGRTTLLLRLTTITVEAIQSEEGRARLTRQERGRVTSELGRVQLKSVPGKMSKFNAALLKQPVINYVTH